MPVDESAKGILGQLGIETKDIKYAGGDDGSPSQLGSTAKPIRGLIRRQGHGGNRNNQRR